MSNHQPTQWALITGAGSGIGQACALELAQAGYGIVLWGRRRAPLQSTQHQIQNAHRQAKTLIIQADLTDVHTVTGACERIQQYLSMNDSTLHYLVHAAGVGDPQASALTSDPEAMQRSLAVNVTGSLALTQKILPVLRQTGGHSRIMFVGAGIDENIQPGTGPYGVSKMALKRLFRQLIADQAHCASPNDPAIALLQPGMVDTPGLRQHTAQAEHLALPHAAFLREALTAERAPTAKDIAPRIVELLCAEKRDAFHAQEIHL